VSKTKGTCLKKVHLYETTLTRTNWENRVRSTKSVRVSILYRYITRTDFERNFYHQLSRVRVVLSIKDLQFKLVSFVETLIKCYIFKIGEQSLRENSPDLSGSRLATLPSSNLNWPNYNHTNNGSFKIWNQTPTKSSDNWSTLSETLC